MTLRRPGHIHRPSQKPPPRTGGGSPRAMHRWPAGVAVAGAAGLLPPASRAARAASAWRRRPARLASSAPSLFLSMSGEVLLQLLAESAPPFSSAFSSLPSMLSSMMPIIRLACSSFSYSGFWCVDGLVDPAVVQVGGQHLLGATARPSRRVLVGSGLPRVARRSCRRSSGRRSSSPPAPSAARPGSTRTAS